MAAQRLSGKHIVIVGGASGFGLETARQALAAGAILTIGDVSTEKLSKASSALSHEGHDVKTGQVDVDDEQSVNSFFSDIQSMDHLFITAGKLDRGNSSALKAPLDELHGVLVTRLMGPVLCIRAAHSKLARDGSVLLASGLDALRPGPDSTFAATSTEGVVGLTRALALDLKPVRVNCLMPGLIDTPLWENVKGFGKMADVFATTLPVPRRGLATDIAEGAIFLLTNTYTTGTTLHIDGGAQLV